MEVFPMIFSRNYYMDYSPDFYVCPVIADDETVRRIRKYILDAIRYPNMIDNKRRVVVSENGFTLCGIVCDLREYVDLELSRLEDYYKYTQDNKGRSVIAFLGVLFKSADLQKNYVITDFDDIMKLLFQKYIADESKWFDERVNHRESGPIEVDTEMYHTDNKRIEKIEYCGKKIFSCSDNTDRVLFSKMIASCGGEKNSHHFCSDYYRIESVKDSAFQVLTSKYITKINKLPGNAEESLADKSLKNGRNIKNKNYKKKTQVIVLLVIVLLITVVVIISIINSGKEANMSKIDMNKPGAHKLTSSVNPVFRDSCAESYVQYLDACGQLLTKYKTDIEFIEKMQADLRSEKLHFWEVDLPKVKKILEKEGIPQQQILEWMNEVKQNHDSSFAASEQILKDFSIASLTEMKDRLGEILNG